MKVQKHNYFYLKRENVPEHIYERGSDYWFLDYFKDAMYVLDSAENEIRIESETLYLCPPGKRMSYKSASGGPYVHTLFMFEADGEYMDSLGLPYMTPIHIKDKTRLESLMFEAEKCQLSGSAFKQDEQDAHLLLILLHIHDSITKARPVYSCEAGEDLRITRLNVMNSTGVLWTVGDMAKLANMSVSGFARKYKKIYGKTPMEDLYDYRYERARMLIETGYSNTYILNSCGFRSLQHFSRFFKERSGMSPSEYRKRLRRETDEEND